MCRIRKDTAKEQLSNLERKTSFKKKIGSFLTVDFLFIVYVFTDKKIKNDLSVNWIVQHAPTNSFNMPLQILHNMIFLKS